MSLNPEFLFDKFRQLKVVVVGDVMLDTYLHGNVSRISPEAPVPVVSIEERDERPGGAANVALNIKSLGATPLLCTVTGKDGAGSALNKVLRKNKIETRGLCTSPVRITSVKTRVLSRNQQMIRYDSEMTSDLSDEDEKMLLSKIEEVIRTDAPRALIFEDYNKGILTPRLIENVISICRTKKIITAVDPKKKNFFAYKNADLFKPNLRELREAFNIDLNDPGIESLSNISRELKKKLHHNITMITLSEHGIFFRTNSKAEILPAHKRDISDVSGAGDTVISVATLCLAAGIPVKGAAWLANIAGGLVCEHVGVVPVTKKMLQQELKLWGDEASLL